LAGSLAIAQGVSTFRPHGHLDGWGELVEGDFADLYQLDPFEQLEGRELSEQELADIRARWNEECQRVAVLIAEIKKDPHEMAVRALLGRLEEHRYLGRTDYTRVDTHEPFVFMVQPAPKDDPEYVGAVADFYGAWFSQLESIFREEFVTPLGLTRRPGTPYVIFVLYSRGAYVDYADALELQGLNRARAFYDPELQIAVTYRDSFGNDRDRNNTERRAALHELVHAMQHAHYGKSGNLPENPWLNEGLAEYLSSHDQVMPGVLKEHYCDKRALATMLEIGRSLKPAKAIIFPLEEIMAHKSYDDVVEACFARARQVGAPLADYSEIGLTAFYAQSNLWVHFLRHGEQGAYRERFDHFVGDVQQGAPIEAAFTSVFDDVDLAQLDREFRKHVNSEGKSRLKQSRPVIIAPEPFRMRGKAVLASSPSPTPAGFEPSSLLPDGSDPEIAFATALGQAANGAFGAARAGLAELLETTDGDWGERVRREVELLDEVISTRRRFLEHLRDTDRKLILRKRAVAKIEAIESDAVLLDGNPWGPDRIALDAVDPIELSDLMRDKKYKFESGIVPGYIYLLQGHKKWSKALPSDDPRASDLRSRGEAEYRQVLGLAREAAQLRQFAEAGVPGDPIAARALFDSTCELYRGDSTLVAEKRPALASYGRTNLTKVFEAEGLREALMGDVTVLAGGRIRIDYPLKRQVEFNDFVDCEEGAESSFPASDFAMGHGVVTAKGEACMRHRLSFEGAQVYRFSFRYRFPGGSTRGKYSLSIRFNADEQRAYVSFNEDGVEVVDSDYHESDAVALPDVKELVEVELRYDGERELKVFVNGRQGGRLDCGPRKSGDFFVQTSGTMIFELSELSLEGDISEASLARLRDSWISEQLREAGMR
jgi:hypothetical protein